MDASSQNWSPKKLPSEGQLSHAHERASETVHAALIVRQPEKIKSLLVVLGDIERISERVTEDASQDLGAAGGGAAQQGGQGQGGSQITLRQKAIQNLPTTSVMREKLVKHLQREVRHLEREARNISRTAAKGSAFVLTQMYAKIRKVQSLITEVLEAVAELVERLYVRLFIDHQQLV